MRAAGEREAEGQQAHREASYKYLIRDHPPLLIARADLSTCGPERNQPLTIINPQILTREGEASTEEGCLSVPGIFDEVKRAAKIRLRAQDRDGNLFERDLEDILAVCVQHEMDHLEGKLFVDYLSDLKRERIRKKLEKERKDRATGATATA